MQIKGGGFYVEFSRSAQNLFVLPNFQNKLDVVQGTNNTVHQPHPFYAYACA